MKKVILTILGGLSVLVVLQGYLIMHLYADFNDEIQQTTTDLLKKSLKNELYIRLSHSKKDPKNLKFKVKRLKDMTIEELDSLNKIENIYDVINNLKSEDKKEEKEYSSNNMQDLVSQLNQDILNEKGKSIDMAMLDTLYNEELIKILPEAGFMLKLYDAKDSIRKEVRNNYKSFFQTLATDRLLIGKEYPYYVQATISLPPSIIARHLLYVLLISMAIIGIVSYCFFIQLRIIRSTRRELKDREESMFEVIHDLKSPLNGTFSILDFMRQTATDDDILNIIDKSKKQIGRLTGIVESMLADIKDEFTTCSLKTEETDIKDMINYIEKELDDTFDRKQHTWEINIPDNLNTIKTNGVYMERCLRNLMENALKYSDDGVRIEISISQNKKHIQIAIDDNGWGIARKEQKMIGKKFFKSNRTDKPKQEGFGIGLSSVCRLVREMGGTLTFKSKEGIGSTFFINLPSIIN